MKHASALAMAVTLFALPARGDPADPPFCATAIAARTACVTHADCSSPTPLCTREFNRQLHHAWTHGSCVDPDANISATWALQADFCTIPHPRGWSGATVYYLPAAARLWIDDPDLDGVAVTIFRRVTFEMQNTTIATHSHAVLKYTAFRAVVPLLQNEGWEYPPGDKYAAFTVIRDASITSSPHYPNQNTGILIQAHGVKVQNFKCWHMGLCVDVDGKGDQFNADNVGVDDLVAFGQYGAGIYLHGADSNAFVGFRPEFNSGPGIWDSSFLQANWIAPMCEQCNQVASNHPNFLNQTFSFRFEGNHTAVFGGYLELGQDFASVGTNTVTVFSGNYLTRITGPAERVGGGWSRLRFATPGYPYETIIGSGQDALFVQARPNTEGVPAEIYGQQLKLRNFGLEWFWGLFNEDQSIPAPFMWRSSDTQALRGLTKVSAKLVPGNLRTLAENTQPLCCDGVDNDGDGDTDFADSECNPETMEC